MSLPRRSSMLIRLCLAVASAVLAAGAAKADINANALELGYRHMYNLEFQAAHDSFAEWNREHPDDPLGPVSDAAAFLFSEFDRLHILQSEFFLQDAATFLDNKQQLTPDPRVRASFTAALAKAQQLSDRALSRSPGDKNATFASVLRLGLQSDYQALIDKRYMASLSEMKRGRAMAQQLVSDDPGYYDAYLAIGVENYLLSLKPAPVRWILRVSGAQTDKQAGLDRLKLTAERGHLLRPFARLLLAVAALRDNNKTAARTMLAGLAGEFPGNRLYAEELARLR